MLSPHALLVIGFIAGLGASAAAQDDRDGLQRPERLTIGTADQLLGSLSPDEQTLYFASNRNTIMEIFEQQATAGAPKLLFDEEAEVTWPRVSPDGKQLLYVSFRRDASGQLCARALPKGDARCLSGSPGAVQAQWVSASTAVLLSRPSAQSDMRVSLVDMNGGLSAKTLFDRNVTSLAASPDGRWLVYTPIERYVPRIGPGFAARAGRDLVAQRLDRPGDQPVVLKLDAPGLTGQAAFSTDGKILFFIQFTSDSNHDGLIDGDDHGVLFRVPFDTSKDDAPGKLIGASPEQLTDASWNCQYPSPSAHRVVMTCDHGGHLDAYSLPLSGMVPDDWDVKRLRAEADVTTSDYKLMLLHTQILQLEKDPEQRRSEMVSLLRLHLRTGEFEAADFYSTHISREKNPATAGVGSALRALCEHRRALRARERGRLTLDFAIDSKARFDALGESKARSPVGNAARHIVRSEIADVMGDKDAARAEIEAVDVDAVDSPGVLELYADRVDALYRELDDLPPLIEAYRRLSTHPSIGTTDHIGYARSALRNVVRGRPRAEALRALDAFKAEPGSDLAFSVTLARGLLDIVDAWPTQEIKDRVLALYKAQTTPERRRAVVVDVMEKSWERGADDIMQSLVELYVKDVPKGTVERRRAARMYRRMIEDRAYARFGKGDDKGARDDFYAVAHNVGSLESWGGYIDRRLHEGATIAQLEADIAKEGFDQDGGVARYVRAYLIARRLPKLGKDEANREADAALALIRGAWGQLKEQPEALALMGAVLHEKYLHSGNRELAQRATAVYLIALDLARRNPRYKALLLTQLALIQAQVGNWRIAIDYFDQREKLPFVDNLNGLTHRLTKARTLLHLDRDAEAAKLVEQALATVDKTPRMEKFRALVLDRDALYHLSAGKFDRALALYDQLVPMLVADKTTVGARNRLVVRLAQAAAALGAGKPQLALERVDGVEKLLETPNIGAVLRWPHATEQQAIWTYRVIATGLIGKAFLALGRLPEAHTELVEREGLYKAQIRRSPADALIRELALAEAQLGELALQRHDGMEALARAKLAVERLDPVMKRSNKVFDTDQLVALWLAADARLATDARAGLKLRQRIGDGIDKLSAQGDRKTNSLLHWLEIELALLGERPGASRNAPAVKLPK